MSNKFNGRKTQPLDLRKSIDDQPMVPFMLINVVNHDCKHSRWECPACDNYFPTSQFQRCGVCNALRHKSKMTYFISPSLDDDTCEDWFECHEHTEKKAIKYEK